MTDRSNTVRALLDVVRADGRTALSAPECRTVCEAYAIPLAKQAFAASPGLNLRLMCTKRDPGVLQTSNFKLETKYQSCKTFVINVDFSNNQSRNNETPHWRYIK